MRTVPGTTQVVRSWRMAVPNSTTRIPHQNLESQKEHNQHSPIKHPITPSLEVLIVLAVGIVAMKDIHTSILQKLEKNKYRYKGNATLLFPF